MIKAIAVYTISILLLATIAAAAPVGPVVTEGVEGLDAFTCGSYGRTGRISAVGSEIYTDADPNPVYRLGLIFTVPKAEGAGAATTTSSLYLGMADIDAFAKALSSLKAVTQASVTTLKGFERSVMLATDRIRPEQIKIRVSTGDNNGTPSLSIEIGDGWVACPLSDLAALSSYVLKAKADLTQIADRKPPAP